MTPEQHDWTPITGFERYAISRAGLIFNTQTEKLLKIGTCKTGTNGKYKVVYLYPLNGKKSTLLLHRLLAIAFLPKPDNLNVVDHIDRNSLNNDINNLRWVDAYINSQNRKNTKNARSSYMGVTYSSGDKWRASLTTFGVKHDLGVYPTELEAGRAYDRAALAAGVLHHNGLIEPRK